jgi:hypothetical protein
MSLVQNIALALFILFQVFMGISKAEPAATAVGERVLITVIDLHSMTQKKGLYPTLYQGEELLVKRSVRRKSERAYAHVVQLTGYRATLEEFKEVVESFEKDDSIKAIDVVFYLHGHSAADYGAPELCFNRDDRKCIPSSQLVTEFSHYRKLRALYSDACHGSEMIKDLTEAGFKVVSGSLGTDSNFMLDLNRFLKSWTSGGSFDSSIAYANETRLGQWIDRKQGGNSQKIVGGEGLLQIDSPMP